MKNSSKPHFATAAILALALAPVRTQAADTTIDGGTSVTVPGTYSSPWNLGSNNLIVGDTGLGTLTIQNNGDVSSSTGTIGQSSTGDGTAIVTGTGSTWNITGLLKLGSGKAQLTVSNGGYISSYQGGVTGTNATATVTGAGSLWQIGNYLVVTGAGASLNVSSLGKVTSYTGQIGSGASVNVTGTGSKWTVDNSLSIGDSGKGTLTVANGATVSSSGGTLGSIPGSEGNVTVTGEGSAWTVSGSLYVGFSGKATLTIADGGSFAYTSTTSIANIGYDSGADATVTVTDAGSTWTSSRDVVLGHWANATMILQNGAAATVGTSGSGTLTAGSGLGQGTLNIGAYDLANATTAGTLNAASVVLQSAASAINFNQTDATSFSIAISGSGTVNQRGAGTTILTGTNTYTGATTVSAGALIVDGSLSGSAVTVENGGTLGGSGTITGDVAVDSGGTLSPGDSPELLTLIGNLTLDAASTTLIELSDTAFDQISVSGAVQYGGLLSISLLDGYVPEAGDTFLLFENFTSYSGEFETVSITNLTDPSLQGIFDASTGILSFAQVPEPSAALLLSLTGIAFTFRRRAQRPLSL